MNKACEVIKEIMGRGIEWFDYQKLSSDKKRLYYQESQRLLRSDVLVNEVNAYITDLVKEIAYNSEDFKKVENLRYSINGVKALLERLESINNPDKSVSTDNLDEAI